MKGLFPISIFTIIVLFSIYQNSRIWDKVSDVNQFTHQVIIENKKLIKQTDQNLIPRLPVYPSYINKDWLSPRIYEKVSNVVNENGYPKEHEFTK